ncbi:MAG: ribonuclease R [Clostridium sp.]|nr:ribonuclease R [Clostridium sp.]
MICDLVKDKAYVPMKEKELAVFLGVGRQNRKELRGILSELLAEGELLLTSDGKYQKGQGTVFTGTFISNAKGFGFVEVDGLEQDLYIPEGRTNGAFHKDTVQVALDTVQAALDTVQAASHTAQSASPEERSKKRQEAQVVKILERGLTQVVGTYQRSGNSYGFVVPDNRKLPSDVFVPKERSKGAVTGHKVVAEITDYGDDTRSPEGKITEILGHIDDPGVDILSVARNLELPTEFPESVQNQAQRASREVTEADRAGRRDLRAVPMATIDGEDAKDLDDAISLDFDGKVYHLGVHIADVANYVQENSALDREALRRGTSVYLTDRVIPMLPHALSNGICSLNEGVDRLALSCLMTIDGQGEVSGYELCESVINVNRRMTYTAVKNILEDPGTEEEQERDAALLAGRGEDLQTDWKQRFQRMEELAAILREKRRQRGAIDFDFPECKIVLNQAGQPVSIRPYERNTATGIIEEFMLAANETVARHFYWMELPFLYRVHDTPDGEKIRKLSAFLHNFGYYMKSVGSAKSKISGEEVHPKEIQKLLGRIEGTPEEAMISRMALRSMKQAKYSTESTGHFGLACGFYCHFTSPIRRYPDLQIHRIIKEQLRGRLKERRIEHYRQILPEVAKHSSETERRADEAERETDKLKKAQYMEAHLGEEFRGAVSGITSWGIYVELENTVEGLVHVSKLPGDYFIYREDTYEMTGRNSGKSYQLGMPVVIRVDGTDRLAGTIDFSIAGEE